MRLTTVFQFLMLIFLLAGSACSKPAETISQATPIENILPSNPLENPFETTKTLAESGDAQAQLDLGRMYLYGEGVPINEAEGVKWFALAAAQGHVVAQFDLGLIYDGGGTSVIRDEAEAVKWYRLAADQGLARAQYNLGVMYDNGEGVIQDYAEAVKWFALAAAQGHAFAQNMLGSKYRKGIGVIQDYSRAHMWFNLSAAKSNSLAATNRDIVEAKMTPQQIEEAQDLARECVKKEYKGC